MTNDSNTDIEAGLKRITSLEAECARLTERLHLARKRLDNARRHHARGLAAGSHWTPPRKISARENEVMEDVNKLEN